MKKHKFIIATTAVLLTTTPIISVASNINQNNIVKAAENEDESESNTLISTSKKASLTLAPGDFWDYDQVANDISLNEGKVVDVFNITTYKKDKDGNIDWGNPVESENSLSNGDTGVIIAEFEVSGLKENTNYTYLTKVDNGPLVSTTKKTDDDENDPETVPAIEIPFVVGSKHRITVRKTTQHYKKAHHIYHAAYKRGSIKVRRNHRIRTYNSRGHFNHHYVYGKHSYKFNQRKVIKGKVYYKLYGLNRYVLALNIKF